MPSPRLAHDTRVLGSVLGLPKGRAEVASLRRLEMMAVSDDSGSRKKNDPGTLMGKAVSAFAGPLSADSRLGVVIFDQAFVPRWG